MTGTYSCSESEDFFLERQIELEAEDNKPSRKNKAPNKHTVVTITKIYVEKGPLSTEFYEAIHNLLAYLQHRYIGSYDEDVQVDCYLRVIKSFEEYDPNRSNLVTWIHTIIRFYLSNVRYSINKRLIREGTQLHDGMEGGYFDYEGVRERDRVATCISRLTRVKVISPNSDFSGDVSSNADHPLNIRALWEEDLCPSESQGIAAKTRMKKPVISILWG
jgi:hypothetical protein